MNDDEDAPCDVCRLKESEPSNEMVFCDVCDVCVHQACYGLKEIPKGQWFCKPCEQNIRPKCIFCPSKKGAMKQTEEGRWAHVSCALWIPEVVFGDPEKMDNIVNTHKIPKRRWNLTCSLCPTKVKEGACIQCYVKPCKTAYHVTCAFDNNLFMAMEDVENSEQEIKFESFCLEHSRIHASGQNPHASKPSRKRKKYQENLESIESKITSQVPQIKEHLEEEKLAPTPHYTGYPVVLAAENTSESNAQNVDNVNKNDAGPLTEVNLAAVSKRTARKSFATPPPPKKIKPLSKILPSLNGNVDGKPKGQSSNKPKQPPLVQNGPSTAKKSKPKSTLKTPSIHQTQFADHEGGNNSTEHSSSLPNSSADVIRNHFSSPDRETTSTSVKKKQQQHLKKSRTPQNQTNSNSINDLSSSNLSQFLASSTTTNAQQSLSDVIQPTLSAIPNNDNFECFSRYLISLLRPLPFKKSLRIQKKIISLVLNEHNVCSEDEFEVSSVSSEE